MNTTYAEPRCNPRYSRRADDKHQDVPGTWYDHHVMDDSTITASQGERSPMGHIRGTWPLSGRCKYCKRMLLKYEGRDWVVSD